jgi:predicted porin
MNKKLIALALATAFAAPVAMADSGNVVIYGRMGVSYDNVNGSSATGAPAGDNETRSRVSSNNSYLGFKGSEDLGNGLAAVWQWEQSIAMETQTIGEQTSGSPTLGNQSKRNTFVGLSSKSMGSLTFGVQDSPLKVSTKPIVEFGDDTIADFRTLFTNTSSSIRAANSALYTSPDMSGFVGMAMLGAQNELGNSSWGDPTFYSLSGSYTNGPIFGSVAYESNKTVTAANSDNTLKTTRLAFGYNFGAGKAGIGYEKEANSGSSAGTGVNSDSKAWYLSGEFNISANDVLKAAYTKRGDVTGTGGPSIGGQAICTGCDAKQWAIGVDHNMSKRTKLYALYTTVQNATNATYSLGGGATGIAGIASKTGDSARALSLGMTHTF